MLAFFLFVAFVLYAAGWGGTAPVGVVWLFRAVVFASAIHGFVQRPSRPRKWTEWAQAGVQAFVFWVVAAAFVAEGAFRVAEQLLP